MLKYVPLRLNTEFSIESGIIRLTDAVNFAKSQNLPALGLSDLMNLFGLIKFYKLCINNGIKPIIGVDFFIKENDNLNEYTNLLLIAKNISGYKVLCQLLTKSYLENTSNIEKAFIQLDWLKNIDTSDLICLSGAQNGAIGKNLIQDNINKAKKLAILFNKIFPNSFYLEIQRFFDIKNNENETINKRFKILKNNAEKSLIKSIQLAEELSLPVVATHPAYFLNENDYEAHEVRVCINSSNILNNDKRIRNFHPSQYFLTCDEIQKLFHDIPKALKNSYLIAQRCNVNLTLNKIFLPTYETPNNQPLSEHLTELALKGLNERFKQIFNKNESIHKKYLQRLNYELEIIIKMDFAGYFLIVADFINWAKNHGCPVGPGRGSGAGSLVAYSLKITDLDPIKYNLLFERFLNPERISMPDFDIDFCQEKRNLVIDYVRKKYGGDSVSQIITFSTLSSKAVIRDVGRVLQLPFSLCDKLSKLIPIEKNKPLTLTKSMEIEPQIENIIKEEEAEKLIELAKKLEDLTRGAGMHAGGVLIAPSKIYDFCPIYRQIGENCVTVSMYDKDDIEEIGLIKFDFLGLRNLTIIEATKSIIKENKNIDIDISSIDLADQKVFDLFQKANTTAVFQFESIGMKKMLQEAKPTKFEEIIAFVALYRPGPMDLIPDFIKRMHKIEKIEYLHPILEKILKDTYGIMVYQEQVMQVAQICGGYSLGNADILRKAIGKKKIKEMKKLRKNFIKGSEKNNISFEIANQIFDYMEKFAGYGFNKSHAACYALIAYQTAWLKVYYTVEFIAATMSSELHNTDQLKELHEDAIINKINFLPPCVNNSTYKFKVVSKNSIRYALGALKGIGENVVEDIIKKRNEKPFTDLFDFCCRLDKTSLNKKTLESLIKGGTFDEIDKNRAQLLENINIAINLANHEREKLHQTSLFNNEDNVSFNNIPTKKVTNWSRLITLEEEKKAIGFYFSDHPFNIYKEEIKSIINDDINDLQNSNTAQWIFGFIRSARNLLTKNNKKVCMLNLYNSTYKYEVLVPEELLNLHEKIISIDKTLIIKCKINNNKFSSHKRIIAQEIMDINMLREKYTHSIEFFLDDKINPKQLTNLIKNNEITNNNNDGKDGIMLKVHYKNNNNQGTLVSNKKLNIIPNKDFFAQLENMMGNNQLKINLKNIQY